MTVLNDQQREIRKMQSSLKELLPRWEIGFLISVFAIGFFVTLLSIAMMVSDAQANETYCREYRTEFTLAGKQQEAYGTVCRRTDGTWEVQTDGAAFSDGTLLLAEDRQDEPEIAFYEGAATHIVIGEDDEDSIVFIEEHVSVVIMENEDAKEIIILD